MVLNCASNRFCSACGSIGLAKGVGLGDCFGLASGVGVGDGVAAGRVNRTLAVKERFTLDFDFHTRFVMLCQSSVALKKHSIRAHTIPVVIQASISAACCVTVTIHRSSLDRGQLAL